MPDSYNGLRGVIGGKKVSHMIEVFEEDMARGKQVSSAPSTPEEAAHLQQVQRANRMAAASHPQDKHAPSDPET
ncbi:MAG: hypothetical protein LIO46_05615 [Clostridiales bacterium]|nr:hypothetical protein [Clostridiales bacterium]